MTATTANWAVWAANLTAGLAVGIAVMWACIWITDRAEDQERR